MAIPISRTHLIALTLLLFAVTVFADCTCDPKDLEKDPKTVTTRYKVGALFLILVASGLGVAAPLAGKKIKALSPEGDVFFMIKAFAAGVILATGFIHILPDSFEQLSSPCLKGSAWENFPFAGFVAMVAAIATLMIESTATGYYRRMHFKGEKSTVAGLDADVEHSGHVHMHTHAAHGHSHDDATVVGSAEATGRLELIGNVLELGIMVHSVIIGVTLGTAGSLSTIKPLMAALCFHQFFEGMGLGGCIAQAKFKWRAMLTMAMFFCLTTPLGLAIGIGITNIYNENSPTSLIVQGVFDSAASGILIYMALVDLLAADFMNPRVQNNPRIQLGSNISLLLGAGCMSVLAKWA
ncbi:uncharacterized protein [Phyllobates terribilis]|uniref:uncharacterized protein n=1 Tax=Phyllobates terribilis TaxID=111132 RepID=UPI003CCAB405